MNILQLDKVASGSWNRTVTFEVKAGEVLLLLGRNGAGKTTLLNTIAGLLEIRSGRLSFQDEDITFLSAQERVKRGLRIALEGRRLFPRLSVRKNLRLGAFGRLQANAVEADIEWVTGIFPSLLEKLDQPAGTLSGGQQTQLNIARALMGRPKLLLLDEPALGLDPKNVITLIGVVKKARDETGLTAVIAEQGGQFAEAFPQRVLLVVGGEIVFDGPWARVAQEKELLMVLK